MARKNRRKKERIEKIEKRHASQPSYIRDLPFCSYAHKKMHPDREQAQVYADAGTQKEGELIHVYRCPVCEFYHIGHEKWKPKEYVIKD